MKRIKFICSGPVCFEEFEKVLGEANQVPALTCKRCGRTMFASIQEEETDKGETE